MSEEAGAFRINSEKMNKAGGCTLKTCIESAG
jgi:hypothetical protein